MEYWKDVKGDRASHCTVQPKDRDGRGSTLIIALWFLAQLQELLTHYKGWVLRGHIGPTTDECVPFKKFSSRWMCIIQGEQVNPAGNKQLPLNMVCTQRWRWRSEAQNSGCGWSCEPMNSLGNLTLISTLDLLAPFEKHSSVAQLGLTPRAHSDSQENTAMLWVTTTQFPCHHFTRSELFSLTKEP